MKKTLGQQGQHAVQLYTAPALIFSDFPVPNLRLSQTPYVEGLTISAAMDVAAAAADDGGEPVRNRHIKKRALRNKSLSVSFDEKDLKCVFFIRDLFSCLRNYDLLTYDCG